MALNGYVLVGDSQLRRFARFCSADNQFCFSGCTISDLKTKLKASGPPKKVIVLIGSNDLMKNASLKNLTKSYVSLVQYLLRNCEKIVLIVCPVIPRKQEVDSHWEAVNHLKSLTYSFSANDKISILDLDTNTSKMILKPHFFEDQFDDGRVDQLHLNRNAFQYLLLKLQQIVKSSP